MEIDQENMERNTRNRKQRYRELLNKIEDLYESEDLGLQTAKELNKVLREVNSIDDECPITERLKHADETLLDSIVLSSSSDLLVKCVESVSIFKPTYEATEFASKIIEAIKSGDDLETDDLSKLLPFARQIIPSNPHYSFLFGTFDPKEMPTPKVPKERQKKEAFEKADKKRLEKVVNIEKEEQSIDETVSLFVKVLQEEYVKNNETPIKYYDYVIDKSSFANTVENIFYASFLVREGKAKMDVDNRGIALICPMRKRELKDFRNCGGKNTQIITSITMAEWRDNDVKEGFLERHKKNIQQSR